MPQRALALTFAAVVYGGATQILLGRKPTAGRTLPVPPMGGPGPFGLADADGVTEVLTGAGFDRISLEEVEEPIEFGRDAADAFAFVRTMGIVEGLTKDLDDETKAATMDRVRAMLSAHETDDGVLLDTSSWLITARRI